jgi:hypothetical protein
MYTKRLLAVVAAALMLTTAASAGNTQRHQRTLSGTYVCLTCEMEKIEGARCQCDVYGHHYCLRLDDGRYVSFLPNDHSMDLIKGGGRKDFRMKVTGLYNPQSRSIDVQSYEIDGIKTVWNAKDGQMEMVRARVTTDKKKDEAKDNDRFTSSN